MYRSANVSAGRAGGRRWAQQHPPPAGARSADARAPPQVLLRSWSRLTRAPSYATPSRPDRTNCRKAFHWPHRPASSWYHFSWRNLHRRANADSLFGTNVEITPPSISNHFCYGTWDLKEPECLTQARLITAAPEFVFEQLKFYGENVGKGHGKAELENQLLIRDDKLINLALAQFGTDKAIVVKLYNRTSDNHTNPDHEAYDKGLRVACLSNRHFDYFNWPDFDLNALMSKGLSPEAAALLSNPSVPPSVLVTLFKKTESFSQVDEKNWLWMIQTAANNERLNTDESTIDGPDMGLWDIHKAIFHFLETAPVTSHSVHATRTLLNALEPKHCAWPDEISYIIDRWRKAEVKNYKGDVEEGWSTHLPLSEELACLIGILYGHRSTTQKNKPSLFGTADDKDIPLRCAYYGCAQLPVMKRTKMFSFLRH